MHPPGGLSEKPRHVQAGFRGSVRRAKRAGGAQRRADAEPLSRFFRYEKIAQDLEGGIIRREKQARDSQKGVEVL